MAGEQDKSQKPEGGKPNPDPSLSLRQAQATGREKDEGGGNAGGSFDFETWLKAQSQEVQEGLKAYEKGLKSALSSERTSRETLEKELREAAKKVEAGSEAEKKLIAMADQLADAQREMDFYKEASGKGVVNPELAFIAAEKAGLFDSRGRMNWDGLKEKFPELFAKTKEGNSYPGAGTDRKPGGRDDMNVKIRRAAGRA